MFDCVVGILVSVKNRADQKINKLKESYDHLVQRATELQERNDKLVTAELLHKKNVLFWGLDVHIHTHTQRLILVHEGNSCIYNVIGAIATTEETLLT